MRARGLAALAAAAAISSGCSVLFGGPTENEIEYCVLAEGLTAIIPSGRDLTDADDGELRAVIRLAISNRSGGVWTLERARESVLARCREMGAL